MGDLDRVAQSMPRFRCGLQRLRAFRSFFASVLTSSEATFRSQDASRACAANNDLLAMTRLARPNRLNSCALFFAKPL